MGDRAPDQIQQDNQVDQDNHLEDFNLSVEDLVPTWVKKVEDLSKIYDEKRVQKQHRHLNYILKDSPANINCVIFTPNNKFIASGFDDGSITVMDAETKLKIYSLEGDNQRGIKALAITSNGQYLVSASDRVIKAFQFNSETKRFAQKFSHPEHLITSFAIRDDLDIVFITTNNNRSSVQSLNLEQRQPVRRLHNSNRRILSIKLIGARHAALLAENGPIVILDMLVNLFGRQETVTLERKEFRKITSIAIKRGKPYGQNLIIAGYKNGSVKALNILSGTIVKSLQKKQLKKNPVKQIVLSHDEQHIFTGFKDGTITRWKFGKDGEGELLKRNGYEWDQFAIAKDADFLIACSQRQNSMVIIDIEPREKDVICLESSYRGKDKIISFSISKEGKEIICATCSGKIKFFNSKTKQEVRFFQAKDESQRNLIISKMAITPNNEFIIVISKDQKLRIFNLQNGNYCYTFRDIFGGNSSSVAVTSDSRYVITTSDNFSFRMIDIVERKEVKEYSIVHKKEISCITTTPDDKFIISASHDKSIKLFDIATKKDILADFKDHLQGKVSSVAVTPDNKHIISASDDLAIKIFDLETKEQIHGFMYTNDDQITTLAISSNSRWVASGSKDCSLRIFDIEMQHKLLVYRLDNIHNESVKKVAFDPDNKYLISLSDTGCLKFINFETKMKAAKKRKPREELSAVISKNNELIYVTSDLAPQEQADPIVRAVVREERARLREERRAVVRIEGRAVARVEERAGSRIEGQVFRIRNGEEVRSVAVSLDHELIICGTSSGSIQVYHIVNGLSYYFSSQELETSTAITAVALTWKKKFLVFGCQNKLFKAINWEDRKLQHVFFESQHIPRNIDQAPSYSIGAVKETQLIVLSKRNCSIYILDIENKVKDELEDVHRRTITSVAVSSDGKFFASCSDDRCIKLFDCHTRQLIHWFKKVHEDPFSAIVFSQDGRFLISGSSNQDIKILDVQTRQQIHHFREIHTSEIKYITTTSDNKYIILLFINNFVRVLKLIPTSPPFLTLPNQVANVHPMLDQEIYYVYHGVSHHSNFNAVDHFLFNPQFPIEKARDIAGRWQSLTVYPYQWNILHIVAIRHHDAFLKIMPEYAEFKVPFLLDASSKTPLHYLIAQKNVQLRFVNSMLNYICDYLEALSQDQDQDQRYQTQEIILSMTPLFWYLLIKPDIKTRARFFSLCSIPPPLPYNTEPPIFGKTKTDLQKSFQKLEKISEFVCDAKPGSNCAAANCEANREPNGGANREANQKAKPKKIDEEQITFRANVFNLDYDVLSDDMKITISFLSQQENEDIFQTALIIDLIEHLWKQVKYTLLLKFIFFSVFLIFLSVYLSKEDGGLGYEIVILVWSGLFIFGEILQFLSLKEDYFKDSWNIIDIILYPLIIGYVIARMPGLENELKKAWMSSIIILLGYVRWISNLRRFQRTRNLIEVIITVVRDMWSFLVIIAAIIIGFSFIFLYFRRGRLYGFYLFQANSSLYGPVDDEKSSPSELVWIALIAFLLNVILLNLLISIMGDSRTRVLEKRMKTDSLTRLNMISEAIPIFKCLKWANCHEPPRFSIENKKLLSCKSGLSSCCKKIWKFMGKLPSCVGDFLLRQKWCSCLKAKKKKEGDRGFLVRRQSLSSTYDEGDGEEGSVRIFRRLLKQAKTSTENKIKKLQQDFAQILERRKTHEERFDERMAALEKKLKHQFETELEKTRKDQDEKNERILDLLTLIADQIASRSNSLVPIQLAAQANNSAPNQQADRPNNQDILQMGGRGNSL